jgi:hypothetical protein
MIQSAWSVLTDFGACQSGSETGPSHTLLKVARSAVMTTWAFLAGALSRPRVRQAPQAAIWLCETKEGRAEYPLVLNQVHVLLG